MVLHPLVAMGCSRLELDVTYRSLGCQFALHAVIFLDDQFEAALTELRTLIAVPAIGTIMMILNKTSRNCSCLHRLICRFLLSLVPSVHSPWFELIPGFIYLPQNPEGLERLRVAADRSIIAAEVFRHQSLEGGSWELSSI